MKNNIELHARPRHHVLALSVIVIILMIAISFQVFGIVYPPLVDLPNHLARHAIQCEGELGRNFSQYYNFNLRAVPNLTADLLYQFDWACADIFLTNRIVIQIMALNLVASVYVLHFVLWRKLSIWPAASCLVAYSGPYSYGFENFILASPFAIYLFALWVFLSERKTIPRLLLMVPLSLGLYFFHIIAFAFFIILIAGWELRRAIKAKPGWKGFFARAGSTSLLVLPAFVHFLILNSNSQIQSSGTSFLVLSRIDAFLSIALPRIMKYLIIADVIVPLILIEIMVVLVVLGLRKGVLKSNPNMNWALLFVFSAALLAPSFLSGVAFVHIRFPFLVAAVFIASTNWSLSTRKQIALAVGILALFAVRTYEMKQEWLHHDSEVRELIAAAEVLPEGAWILPTASDYSDVLIRHSHSISYLGLYHPVFPPNLFNGANPLSPTKQAARATTEQLFPPPIGPVLTTIETESNIRLRDLYKQTLSEWLAHFTHFLVIGEAPFDADLLPDGITVIHTGSFFTILENSRLPG